MDWLKELYSEVVVSYAKDPKYRGKIKGALEERDMNESCGDEVTLYVKIEDDRVKDAAFEGVGCVVSQASAAMLDNVKKMLKGEDFDEEKVGDLVVFSNISEIPQRSKCFYLAWSVLERLYDRISQGGSN